MEEKEKKKLPKKTKIFIVRVVLFAVFACVLPFCFIAWRYQLFKKVDSISLSGWGIVALIIIFCFIKYIVKTIKKGESYSMTTQVITGFVKVILPLVILYIMLNSIKGSIDLFLQALCVVIISEGIAIPINPLPKWAFDNHINTQEKTMDTLVSKFWKGKEKGE